MLDEEYIQQKIREAKEYAESRKFPTSSPYDGDPYKARKMMEGLIVIIKSLLERRRRDENK